MNVGSVMPLSIEVVSLGGQRDAGEWPAVQLSIGIGEETIGAQGEITPAIEIFIHCLG